MTSTSIWSTFTGHTAFCNSCAYTTSTKTERLHLETYTGVKKLNTHCMLLIEIQITCNYHVMLMRLLASSLPKANFSRISQAQTKTKIMQPSWDSLTWSPQTSSSFQSSATG